MDLSSGCWEATAGPFMPLITGANVTATSAAVDVSNQFQGETWV